MQRSLVRFVGSLSIAFIIIVIGKYVIVAQDLTPITGEWKSETWSEKHDKEKQATLVNDGKIHLSFQRSTANGRNSHGSSYSLEELGLTPAQVQNGRVSFRLVREAGTVDAEGTFVNGRGSGTFKFTPNRSFVDAMKSRGFDFEKASKNHDDGLEEKLLSAAFINVTTALADDLNSANFGKLEVEDLFKAAIFKVDSKFMAEMKATGFPNLQMEDLVKARIFKIDADYVRQVNDMGFGNRDFEGLVKFRIFKVTPEYLGELKAAGLTNLDSEDVVKCRIFSIDPDFIRKARAEDPNVTLEDLVRMKIGVGKKRTGN
jgi:hypothetical protein